MPKRGHHCCVVKCNSNSVYTKPKPRFFRIPAASTRPELRQKWIQLIQRAPPFNVTNNTRVCGQHFVDGEPTYSNPLPVLNMGYEVKMGTPRRVIVRREVLHPAKKRKTVESCPLNLEMDEVIPVSLGADKNSSQVTQDERTVCSQNDHTYCLPEEATKNRDTVIGNSSFEVTDVDDRLVSHSSTTSGNLPDIKKLTRKSEILGSKVVKLQTLNKTKPRFSISNIKCDDKKVQFYTGLPSYKTFHVIFEKVVKANASKLTMNTRSVRVVRPWYKRGTGNSPKKPGRARKLSLEDEFFLVLMKLKLGLLDEDLADRFGVGTTLARLIINRWIPVVALCLKNLIVWPSKEKVRACMPAVFREKYPNTRVIIDCSEVFIEEPSNVMARQQTYSQYKHHNTVKFLIGISPTGAITTISQLWGGITSDRHIVENSDFLDKLDYGDQVMADRGFGISDLLAVRGCTLTIPPFTHGKTQFDQQEVEKGCGVSTLRIHVERAIERIKTFRILQGVFPLKRIYLLDDILTICASISNLQPPLVD